MDVLTQFSRSPEVASLATANATQLFQQATETAMKLMHSGAFTHVMQEMAKNYTEFLSEISQSWMVMMRQGQDALATQAQQATEVALSAEDVGARRVRRAA
jgi:hypothetical protein